MQGGYDSRFSNNVESDKAECTEGGCFAMDGMEENYFSVGWHSLYEVLVLGKLLKVLDCLDYSNLKLPFIIL